MIYDNSTDDTFLQYYIDDPLGFLTKSKVDTEQARKQTNNLIKNCKKIIKEIDKIEKEN